MGRSLTTGRDHDPSSGLSVGIASVVLVVEDVDGGAEDEVVAGAPVVDVVVAVPPPPPPPVLDPGTRTTGWAEPATA